MKSTVPMYIPLSVNRAPAALPNGLAASTRRARPRSRTRTVPAGVEHEVAGLDVAVNDSLGVSGFEAAGGLDHAVDGLGDGHRPAVADDAIEVTAFDEIHHQEMDAAVFVGVDGGDDVGMLEPAGGLDFAAKSHDGLTIAREGRRQDLQSTDSAQAAVASLEHHAHSALTELVEDDVVADQEPAALFLIDCGGLIGSQLAGVDQARRQAQDALSGIGGVGFELCLVDEADLDQRAREFPKARETRPGRRRRRRRPGRCRCLRSRPGTTVTSSWTCRGWIGASASVSSPAGMLRSPNGTEAHRSAAAGLPRGSEGSERSQMRAIINEPRTE